MTTTRHEGDPGPAGRKETRRQIRGSGLLLVGRIGAMGANLVTQVLIVRYLTTTDYGAFAYALSIVALAEAIVTLGLDRAISRYLPLYEERRDYGAFLGTLVFVITTILGLGVAAVLLVTGLQGWLTGTVVSDAQAVALLAILVVLAPIEAIDAVLTHLFAVFASARVIFVRKYILAPGLRFAVVLLLVLGQFGVGFLALGYVAAGAVGILLYAGMVRPLLRARGLLPRLRFSEMRLDLREILGYTVPLLTTDLVLIFMVAFDAFLLANLHGTEAVGALRAVESAARTNGLAAVSFSVLFMPLATRFVARNEHAAVNDLYWQSTAWIAVLSFPIFALTFGLAETITVLLYGDAYRGSAILLALLALGRYVDSAFGMNAAALRAYGRIRATVGVNLFAALFHLLVSIALIPPFGAVGAAVAVCTTFVAYNVAKQLAVGRTTDIRLFDPHYVRLYVAIAAAAGGLVAFDTLVAPPFAVGLVLAGLASLAVLVVGRRVLRVHETFPELLRMPGARFIVGR